NDPRPKYGNLQLNNNGTFVYTNASRPPDNPNDPDDQYDDFTDTFYYKVFDGVRYSSIETVTIYVDAPPMPDPDDGTTDPRTLSDQVVGLTASGIA
ncbi:MAG: hypothetical protein ACC645_07495, partial [Pirellulales bacterium]